MKETDEMYLLRFRYGRAAEILLAYKTFLNRQVKFGEGMYCQTEENVIQVTHTLLLTFYSFIYSMFDKSGTDFVATSEPFVSLLSDDGRKVRDELIEIWEKNEKAITKLRNNIGFHGGTKIKSHEVGYSALINIHPQIPEFIMNQLAIFFIEIDIVIPPREDYRFHVSPDMRKSMYERAESLRQKLGDSTITDMMQGMQRMYGDEEK